MNAPRDKSYDESLKESLKDPIEAAAYVEAVRLLGKPFVLVLFVAGTDSSTAGARWGWKFRRLQASARWRAGIED